MEKGGEANRGEEVAEDEQGKRDEALSYTGPQGNGNAVSHA